MLCCAEGPGGVAGSLMGTVHLSAEARVIEHNLCPNGWGAHFSSRCPRVALPAGLRPGRRGYASRAVIGSLPGMFTTRPTLQGTFGMVSSTHWLASQSAMAVLEDGGNAYDAAVAGAFVLHVV